MNLEDNLAMRPILATLILSACAHGQPEKLANDAYAFGTNATLSENCELNVTFDGKSTKHKFGFASFEDCRLVTQSGTDILHTLYVNGAYVFIVENNFNKFQECHSTYTAFGIGRDGEFQTTSHIKRSGSCFRGLDDNEFLHFSHYLK